METNSYIKMLSGKNTTISENHGSSKTEEQRIWAGVVRNQNLIIKSQERSEERHRESLDNAEARTLEIINSQGVFLVTQLREIREELTSRIEAVEGQVHEIQTLANQSTDGRQSLPGEQAVGQLSFFHKNANGTPDLYTVDQVIKQGKVRAICRYCRRDYSHNYVKRHILKTCLPKHRRTSNINNSGNSNNSVA